MPEAYDVSGHINPLDSYPAYVIPVVSTSDGEFALFLTEEGSFELERTEEFSRTVPKTLGERPARISDFQKTRLFAFSEEKTFLYEADQVFEFWAHAVNSERILETNPFASLDIAIDVASRSSIVATLAACASNLNARVDSSELINNWYRAQLWEVRRDLRLDLSFPENWRELPAAVALLPLDELPGLGLEGRRLEETLSREGVGVQARNLNRRKGQTLIEGLIHGLADVFSRQGRVLDWRAFFDAYILRLDPSAVARRLGLSEAGDVRSYLTRAQATLRDAFDEVTLNYPILKGLAFDNFQAILSSRDVLTRPQGVDVVFCIDTTGSMEPYIEAARRIVSGFHEAMVSGLAMRGTAVTRVNVRLVIFRDFLYDVEPIRLTSFMRLPQEEWAFQIIIKDLRPDGGGDEAESALEALAIAMDSEWVSQGLTSGRVIVLLTDASAHTFEETRAKRPLNYPSDLPQSLAELRQRWTAFCAESGVAVQRLVLFAPDIFPWNEIAREWPDTIHLVSQAGSDLEETLDHLIIESIAQGLG